MKSCYLFVMQDEYGCEMRAEPNLEDVQETALAYIKEEYGVDLTTVNDLRSWERAQRDVSIKFIHLCIPTLDCLEEL